MPTLVVALSQLKLVLLGVIAVGLALRGPRRWVKIGVVVVLVDALAERTLVEGWRSALGLFAAVVAMGFITQFFALRSWRTARRLEIVTNARVTWPAHAAADIDRWTRELVALGFEPVPDASYAWTFGGVKRTTNLRLFRHATEPCWATLSACANPKTIGRTINSRLADGRFLQTGDRLLDTQMFPAPSVVAQRVSGASCERLLAAQRATLSKLDAVGEHAYRKSEPIRDPVDAHRAARDMWIETLLASNKMRVDGESVALVPAAMLAAIPRVYAAWFA